MNFQTRLAILKEKGRLYEDSNPKPNPSRLYAVSNEVTQGLALRLRIGLRIVSTLPLTLTLTLTLERIPVKVVFMRIPTK
jgi:hypothetical protein